MRKGLFSFICLVVAFPVVGQVVLPADADAQKSATLAGQDYIESMSYNADKRGTERSLQYYPEGEDFVCVNGKNRYTRALYGGYTPFRLETGDRPVFAAYDKKNSKNIRFVLSLKNKTIPLDSTAYCEARYTPGRRSYVLADPSWGKGRLFISVVAFTDTEGGIWKIHSENLPVRAELKCMISEIKAKKLNRNGDMGADPADSFEAPAAPEFLHSEIIPLNGETHYLICKNLALGIPSDEKGKEWYDKAEEQRRHLAAQVKINTPDPYFNTLGGTLAVAADGIWSGEVWLHGAVGWRMPLSGWRAAYVGDALGWHDRARKHFDAYAASQVTGVEPVFPHPAQDSAMNLARAEKKWGTQMYSNGYICRNPHQNNKMHHYDMNLCYIDELLWHFNWTGDLEYARKMWPVLTRHLEWEKRNFDPDQDGLYDAYACIWASDALQYNSGAVTHSSAYNYRANKMVADIARKIGEDPSPYQLEAERILNALNERLWMKDKGCWAEYQDYMGYKRLHENPALWTVYHAIDSEIHDPFQSYQATRYVDTEIPHIPVRGKGLEEGGYATVSTTNWLPYSWSINNVAFAEVMHTALAYWQAGRNEEAFRLLKSSVLDGMYLGNSPGNFGQISFYDAARGECYRDFGDPIGVASRALVQGLYGILPDATNNRLVIRPGFPFKWDHASITTPDIHFNFLREKDADTYRINSYFLKDLSFVLRIPAFKERIRSVKVNGKEGNWKLSGKVVGYPLIEIEVPFDKQKEGGEKKEKKRRKERKRNNEKNGYKGEKERNEKEKETGREAIIEIEWAGEKLAKVQNKWNFSVNKGDDFRFSLASLALSMIEGKDIYDPQAIFENLTFEKGNLKGKVGGNTGERTFFLFLRQGEMKWWQPVHINVKEKLPEQSPSFTKVTSATCEPVDMDNTFNESVNRIFKNEYLSPRSPYTTLQVPKQGIGEWCHPKTLAKIDDTGLRNKVKDGLFVTSLGVPFRTPSVGNNIAFTSLWDNYPDKVEIPLSGKARNVYLLMAGTTNHMQCHIANGIVKVTYADGTEQVLELINPENWCPIEQDYFVDGNAFSLRIPRPYRLHFQTGLVSNDLEKELNIVGVYGRSIEGGAAVLLDFPIDFSKELKTLRVQTLSNEVIIGLMGVTLQR